MKLKAAASRNLPPALLEALDSSDVTKRFYEIINDNLHVLSKDIGPATHFVQETDLTIPSAKGEMGINVAFTMVSKNRSRSDDDFANALDDIAYYYTKLIEDKVPTGMEVQLFCVMALDGEIEGFEGKPVRLLEITPTLVAGKLDAVAEESSDGVNAD